MIHKQNFLKHYNKLIIWQFFHVILAYTILNTLDSVLMQMVLSKKEQELDTYWVMGELNSHFILMSVLPV